MHDSGVLSNPNDEDGLMKGGRNDRRQEDWGRERESERKEQVTMTIGGRVLKSK